ncbi:MAG: flagellar basal-body MS-ring/collar protein FliF [Alphaproteobacteria bacterium]|uniref:flagellar basal-body MS-ring/collar protein FliF n=1 Tax=Pacificispira sp. TaxID=2888761 RepID=UPI002EBC5853|nr:flagellar basal-body MS-ring/collar protein FliF [Pseudomonadota bacterium]
MGGLLDIIRNIGMPRLTAIVAGTATMLGLLLFLIINGTKPEPALLYSDLDPQTTNQIADQLASRGVEYSMSNDQTRISVPRDQVSQLRLEFAEQGLSGGVVGYDIFDRDESLGQSSFEQEINRLRALEGELSRTIASIDNVRGARVHIVMPRREVFTRTPQQATASIIIKMRGAYRLDRTQTAAIQQLVATAVPQLSPQKITIIDDRGTLLHGGGDTKDGLGADNIADMRTGFESRLSGKVTEMLERVVGVGKARVEISAEMDFSQEVQNIQSFDPEQQVLVSSRETENSSQSTEAAQDNVTVGNNLPDAGGLGGGASGDTETATSTESIQNFQTGNTRTERIVPPGRVERLSVAVVVDGIRQPDGTYEARSDAEMEVLRELVESAVGVDRGRGDQVTIHNLRFEDVPVYEPLDEQEVLGIPIPVSDLRAIGQTSIIALLVLLIAFVIVRPLVTRLMDMQQQAAAARAAADQPTMITDQSGAMVAAGGMAGMEGAMVPHEGTDEFEAMIDIAHIEGRVKASSLKKIGEIVEKHPEEAVSILRNWMYQESN